MATIKDPAGADSAATTNGLEVDYASPIDTTGTNVHQALVIDVESANSSGGTNTLTGLQVDGVTADAQITEYAINVATGWDRGLNIAGGGAVIVGTFTVDASEIGSSEIANITRTVSIPLAALIDCETAAGAVIGFDTTADTLPDYVVSVQTFLLRWDDTGGSLDEDSEVCGTLSVPNDYSSGGVFVITAKKDANAGATESFNCAVSVDGAALEAVGSVDTSATAATNYTCTPTIAALAANDSLQFYVSVVSATTMDDIVDVLSLQFQYSASQ